MRTIVACATALVGAVLLAPLAICAAALWSVSAGTRLFARRLESGHVTRDQLIQFDAKYGWRARENLDTYHLTADMFRIRTDHEGWRGRAQLSDSDVVVFGDSFAAGYGIGEGDFYANLCSEPKVKPIGIGGYNMVQELLWMNELAPKLHGRLVVWFIYCGNDLYDNLSPDLRGYRRPFVREARQNGGWEIVTHHVRAEPWPIRPRARRGDIHMATLAELCSDTFLAQRAYGACDCLLRQGRDVCMAAGARLAVLSIPDRHQLSDEGRAHLKGFLPPHRYFDTDLPERHLASLCDAAGVPFVRGSDFLDVSCYYTEDCHWNAEGHRRIAERLTELYTSSVANAMTNTAALTIPAPAQTVH